MSVVDRDVTTEHSPKFHDSGGVLTGANAQQLGAGGPQILSVVYYKGNRDEVRDIVILYSLRRHNIWLEKRERNDDEPNDDGSDGKKVKFTLPETRQNT